MEEKLQVYIVITSGCIRCEPFYCILGVYKSLEDAERVMKDDINRIKKDWFGKYIYPEEWEELESTEKSYEGFARDYDYDYSVHIEKWEVS